jgi:hypothetical protein
MAGFGFGLLVVTVDLQSDRIHRWLFAIQFPMFAAIPVCAVGLSVGLLAIIDVAVSVSEAPLLMAAHGADGYALERVVHISPERLVGERRVMDDARIAMALVGGRHVADSLFRTAALSAFTGGRIDAAERISARAQESPSVARRMLDEIDGKSGGALAVALAAQRSGDDSKARSTIAGAAEDRPGRDTEYLFSHAPQWEERRLLYARDLSAAHPDLSDKIRSLGALRP